MQLSVIIVNYNVKYFLEQCLYSVIAACKNVAAEIIVIDNQSTDGSRTFFTDKFEQVHFIWNDENVGFSRANNNALLQAKGECVLFLNPDTIVAEDCFEKCLQFFLAQKDAGAMGVRMIDGSGKFLKESKRGFPSVLTSFCKLSGLTALFPKSRIFARYYLGHLPEMDNHEVDVLSGAFMMVRKSVLDSVGSFDERFFMYGEDIDLGYRIQQAGFKNYYFAQTTILHFKGESTKKNSLKYLRIFYGAMLLFVQKHYSGAKAMSYAFLVRLALAVKSLGLLKNKLPFLQKRSSKLQANNNLQTIIVAHQKDYDAIKQLITQSGASLNVVGKISVDESTENSLGDLSVLPQLIHQQAIANIIFCIPDLSAKQSIAWMQVLPHSVNFFIHFAGSCSIVGSNNKNIGGEAIGAN